MTGLFNYNIFYVVVCVLETKLLISKTFFKTISMSVSLHRNLCDNKNIEREDACMKITTLTYISPNLYISLTYIFPYITITRLCLFLLCLPSRTSSWTSSVATSKAWVPCRRLRKYIRQFYYEAKQTGCMYLKRNIHKLQEETSLVCILCGFLATPARLDFQPIPSHRCFRHIGKLAITLERRGSWGDGGRAARPAAEDEPPAAGGRGRSSARAGVVAATGSRYVRLYSLGHMGTNTHINKHNSVLNHMLL